MSRNLNREIEAAQRIADKFQNDVIVVRGEGRFYHTFAAIHADMFDGIYEIVERVNPREASNA